MSIVDEIKRSLLDDEAEIKDRGEQLPSAAAKDVCLRLVANVTPLLEAGTNLKWAAFSNDSEIEFTIHANKREVAFMISGVGSLVRTIRLDENLNYCQGRVSTEDMLVLGALISWLSET